MLAAERDERGKTPVLVIDFSTCCSPTSSKNCGS
jgi:hypothetical protein